MEFKEKVVKIQTELKAPKSLRNKFGNYNYRNAESILEASKPYLSDLGLVLTLTDDIIVIGEHKPIEWKHKEYDNYKKKEVEVVNIFSDQRFYIKATATLLDTKTCETLSVSALARESEVKKGMDESQITGTASSYARKYALNGLFLLDDTKDADTDEHKKETTARAVEETKSKAITKKQIDVLKEKFTEAGFDISKRITKPLESITVEEYSDLIEKLNVAIEKIGGKQ